MVGTPELDEVAFRTRAEFGRQIYNLLARGYPRIAGLSSTEFLAHVYPLLARVTELDTSAGRQAEAIPFVIVVKSELAPVAETIGLVERRGRTAISVLDADDLGGFEPTDRVTLPSGLVYLMVDIETGADTRNVTPDAALRTIDGRRRTPLTVEEGVALLTHYPEAVAKNAGFSLLGSRCGDRRVTAMWISKDRPKLGWCWAGNPHTWLGSASGGARLGSR
jgi:Family of unknown function (DUF5701)